MVDKVHSGEQVSPDTSCLTVAHEEGFGAHADGHVWVGSVAKFDIVPVAEIDLLKDGFQVLQIVDEAIRVELTQ